MTDREKGATVRNLNPRVDTLDIRALWMRYWPGQYPHGRSDWALAGGRVAVALVLLTVGYVFGGDHLNPGWTLGGAVIGHACGLLLGLLLAIAADAAAREQGQRVGRWQMAEHVRLQAEDRKQARADAAAAPVEAPAAEQVPAPAPVPVPAPEPVREMAGGGDEWGPGRNTGGHYRFTGSGPLPVDGDDHQYLFNNAEHLPSAPVEPEQINDVIYRLVSKQPGINGMALRALLREKNYEVGEKPLRNHLWQLTALLHWLSYTDKVFTVLERPTLEGDPWPGLPDVMVRLVEDAGDRGLDLTDALTTLAHRGVQIPRARVLDAFAVGTKQERIRFDRYEARYYLVAS